MKMIVTLMAAAMAAGALAQVPVAAPTQKLTAPWKIGGIALGMTPAEVGLAVKEDGYKLVHRFPGRSWQGHVAHQVSISRSIKISPGPEVIRKEDYRLGDEQIQVTYMAGKAGPCVSRVDYDIAHDAIEADHYRRVVRAKYGKPTLSWDWESLYCSAGERQCSRTGSLVTNQLPSLTVYVMSVSRRTLHLVQGERADRAYYAAVRAEAERLYPKTEKPNF
jgi:hypothetical protein